MICLVNPLATRWRYRIPLSVLSIGASLEGKYNYHVLDGNIDHNLSSSLAGLIQQENIRYVGFTVMPGPQLPESIILSKLIRSRFPHVKIIWGGYFPSLHTEVVLRSGYVDYVIRNQGDYSFRQIVDHHEKGTPLDGVKGISYVNGIVKHHDNQELIDPNTLPPIPYHKVDIKKYIGRTYVGSRTINYHSSVGCPFLCGFCAVASLYKARWIGLAPERIVKDLLWFKRKYNVNAVEFHDNNFFTSESRTAEFADLIKGHGITWWGEARPDTVMKYDDHSWRLMREAGCKMIFFGAESSSQRVLDLMDKGGTQTPDTVLALADKSRQYGIVPEFSFVLGSPTPTVGEDIEQDIAYIRKIKSINPESEIVIYVYSPVQFEEADLFNAAKRHSFAYPTTLDEWLLPEWQTHDLRKRPVTPWLTRSHIARIKNFERVLNARYPTKSDLKITPFRRNLFQLLGSWRYKLRFYRAPYEIVLMQRLMRYRQPEIEGF